MTGERRENIARALYEADDDFGDAQWDDEWPAAKRHYRRLADAAIAADGLEQRVRELADDIDGDYGSYEYVATRLRNLLDGADNGRAT